MKKVDYSSDAITRRLKQTEQLRVLSLSLMKAKKAHDEKLKKKEADETVLSEAGGGPSKEPTS
jgi:hypothetical protein